MLGVNSLRQLPEDRGIEVAFAGRSNVGKSSVINAVTGIKNLARTSKTPGRTREINFFYLDEDRRLVDLPGYGYARVSGSTRDHWAKLLDGYFNQRQSLSGLVLIMDIRHPLKPYDEQMLHWCNFKHLPVHILLSKADKLSKSAAINTCTSIKKLLADQQVTLQLFSALQRRGVEQVREKLDSWFDW